MPKWQLVAWLAIFSTLLAGTVWVLFFVKGPQKIDCRQSRAKFYEYIGKAVFDNGAGITAAANRDAQAAATIIEYTPYCYPQALIEQAQQTLGR